MKPTNTQGTGGTGGTTGGWNQQQRPQQNQNPQAGTHGKTPTAGGGTHTTGTPGKTPNIQHNPKDKDRR